MGKPTFGDYEAIGDPLASDNFELLFGRIPGTDDTKILGLKVIDTVIPGFGNEAYPLMVQGYTLNNRGRKTFPRVLPITFYEDRKFRTLRALKAWDDFVVDARSGLSGGYKEDYAIDVALRILDIRGFVVATKIIVNCFPFDTPDIPVSGETSGFVRVSTSLQYDLVDDYEGQVDVSTQRLQAIAA